MTVCTWDWTADGRNPQTTDGKPGKVMAVNEIPLVINRDLLSRVAVSKSRRTQWPSTSKDPLDLTSNPDDQWT